MSVTPSEFFSEIKHRRESRREIWLPIIIGAALLVALVALIVLVVLRLDGGKVSVMADLLMTVFVLLPLALCMLPLYFIALIAAFGLGHMTGKLTGPLRRLQGITRTIAERTTRTSSAINQRALKMRVRVAPAERLLDIFDDKPRTE